jgi:hypothetical protein
MFVLSLDTEPYRGSIQGGIEPRYRAVSSLDTGRYRGSICTVIVQKYFFADIKNGAINIRLNKIKINKSIMKQIFKIWNQYANCNGRTMEIGDHFKNEASLKKPNE